MKLLLFDVDLTLVNTAGCGREAMTQAFQEMFGQRNGFEKVSFAGSTDGGIFREGLAISGLEWSREKEEEFKNRYLKYLESALDEPQKDRHIEPGVKTLLETLQNREGVFLALLTGNWEEGARLKLQHFDLWHFFEFGAYSNDSWIRSDLPKIATMKLQRLKGISVSPSDVFVIGDTPRDVACARPFGATSVAVATGFSSYEQLESEKPHHLFKDLSNLGAFLRILDSIS